MTFAEAAIEVLFRAGRPLHFKKITEAAISENLLSHIGRTPEVTMGERLNQELKKEDSSPVVSVRPGVFALRDDYVKKLESEGHERLPLGAKPAAPAKAEKTNGKATEPAAETKSEDDEGKSRRRSSSRRRRRRGSRNRANEGREESRGESRSSSGRRKSSSSRRKSSSSRRKSSSSRRKSSSSRRKSSSSKREKTRNDRGGRRGERNDGRRSERRDTRRPARTGRPANRHLKEGPVRMDTIAEAALTVLNDNNRRPMKVKDLADAIFERKLVRFHTHDPAATVQAAIAGDNQIREQKGNRPLFIQYDRERWGLTEWGLSSSSTEREQQILTLAEEIRQDAVSHLGQALTDIKAEAVEHLALTLMERLGYRNIKVSKRSSEGDVFFTSDWRQGLADVRVCIQVVGDSALELPASAVTELRGTLHHYSASEGVIIHLGKISADAVKESREEKLAAITLIDRDTFVELLIKHGIGVRTYQTPITMVDTSFIEALASA